MIDPTKSLSYNITIQCSLDGFCFVLYDIEENKIIDIELYQTSDSGDESIIMDALERAIFKKGLYEKPFHSVRFIAGNRFNTLVPEELFDEQHLEAHLLFNHRLPQGHTVKSEILPSLKAVNVYALSTGDYTPENPSSIWKIDAQDNATDTGIGASWLAVQDGVLYTINSVFDENWMTTNYYITYNLSDMSVNSSAFLGENVVDAPAGICIDAEGGNLFVSSYNLAYGYASYDTEGYVNQYDLNGNLVKKYDVGVGPCFMTVLR